MRTKIKRLTRSVMKRLNTNVINHILMVSLGVKKHSKPCSVGSSLSPIMILFATSALKTITKAWNRYVEYVKLAKGTQIFMDRNPLMYFTGLYQAIESSGKGESIRTVR